MILKIAFSTHIHWRYQTALLEWLEATFPATRIRVPHETEALTVDNFASNIRELNCGYHADRMPVVALIPATFSELAARLKEFNQQNDFVAGTVNVLGMTNQPFAVVNLKELVLILTTAASMTEVTPEALFELI